MTTTTPEEGSTQDQTKPNGEIDWDAPDDLLRFLVAAVNKTTSGITITLHVEGSLVSGTLISGKQYFTEAADYVAEVGKGEVVEAFQELYRHMADEIYADEATTDDQEPNIPIVVTYVHMKDVAVWTPGSTERMEMRFWRGRLTKVSAWTLGSYEFVRQ